MAKKAANGAPSPVKYKEWVENEDNLFLVKMWARDGVKESDIAENIGIAHKTLIEWKKRFPEFAEAIRSGREVADYKVENALFNRAIGYDVTETQVITGYPDKNGNRKSRSIRTTKHVEGNVTAMLAWLNNRKPNEWKRNRDTFTVEGDKDIVVKIVKAEKPKREAEE